MTEVRVLVRSIHSRPKHCLVSGVQSPESLHEALSYLRTAENDYLKLEIYESAKHVQYLISVVYHNMGMVGERDAAAKRYFDTVEKHEKISGEGPNTQLLDIFRLMSEVGVGLANR
jgi:anaphase-promoting complex subunit 5